MDPEPRPCDIVSDIVVIGASAGGLDPLKRLICGLSDDVAATIFVTVHIGSQRSLLPEILNYCRTLPSTHPTDGQPIEPGCIYVAPPDQHLMIEAGYIRLSRGPRENRTRPAVDPMFRTAAETYGSRVIGIVLSGSLGDGTAGLAAIKSCGGITIVQDPHDAEYPSMPASALQHVVVDHCLPGSEIPSLLLRLLGRKQAETAVRIPPYQHKESIEDKTMSREHSLKPPALLICPDCGGALKETAIGTMPYYNCHTGHSFSAADMDAGQFQEMERALEFGFRIMVERVALCHRLSRMAQDSGQATQSEQWQAAEVEARERARTLRDFLDQSWIRPSD